MSDLSKQSSVAVTLVAKQHVNLEKALITSVLRRVSLSADRVRWLSRTSGRLAIEAIVNVDPRDERLADAVVACEDVSAAGVDFAILPAENRKKRLLISDMDSTIIAEECLDELADFAGLKAEISAITERAMAGELNFEDALTNRVGMLKGLGLEAIEQCYRERINLNPGAKTLVASMKAHGAKCLLVSGGFTAFTARVAEAAGFEEHYGNTLIDDGTALTGEVGLPILGREAKQERLEQSADARGLDVSGALAIGDGANDLAMIKTAGLGIAYRAKPIVAAEARAAINHTDLTTALFFQGYSADEFVTE